MTDTHVEPQTCISRQMVNDMIKTWQQEMFDAGFPAIGNQGNVLRDRLAKIPAGMSRSMFDAEMNQMLLDGLLTRPKDGIKEIFIREFHDALSETDITDPKTARSFAAGEAYNRLSDRISDLLTEYSRGVS